MKAIVAEQPKVLVRCSTIEAPPDAGVLEAAATAGLLVVERRRRYRLDGFSLSSLVPSAGTAPRMRPAPVATVPRRRGMGSRIRAARLGWRANPDGAPMHELSIAESVVAAVLERTGDRRVTVVRLRVGRLSGVVPDALTFCFDLATTGTCLDGAELQLETPSGRGHCRGCGREIELEDMVVLCPCGSADVDVVAGRELQVASVEVA